MINLNCNPSSNINMSIILPKVNMIWASKIRVGFKHKCNQHFEHSSRVLHLWNFTNRVRLKIDYFLFVQATLLKIAQYKIASLLFTYCNINIIWYHVLSCKCFCRTTYKVMCLRRHKACRGLQGFSTHRLSSWAFSSVLIVLNRVILVYLYCLIAFLFIMLYPYHCHDYIPPFIDRLHNIRQPMSCVNGLL